MYINRKKKIRTVEKSEKLIDFFDVSATTLAEQLTLVESLMYQAIQPPELLNLAWKSGNSAKNIIDLVNRSNSVRI